MTKTMTEQEKRIEALINSVDGKNNFHHWMIEVKGEILENFIDEIGMELTVSARTTSKCWGDGAPVIKYFFRDENNECDFTFEEGEQYHVGWDSSKEQLYWFYGGVWYWTDDTQYAKYFLK